MSFAEYFDYSVHNLTLLGMVMRFLAATLAGAVVGYTRGKTQHAAGLRTHILVCIGAAGTVIMSEFFIWSRGISGVTGRNHVSGLTTAAGLWASACMGLAAGAGYFSCVLVMCTLILLVLEILHKVDKHYIRNSKQMFLYIETNKGVRVGEILSLMNQNGVQVYSFDHFGTDTEDYTGYRLNVEIENKDLTRHGLAAMVTDVDGVVYVSEI